MQHNPLTPYRSLTGLWFFVASLSTGCHSQTEAEREAARLGTTTVVEPSADSQRDKVKTEATETVQAARDYVYAERAEYIAERNRELEKLEAETNRLSAQAEKSGEAVRESTKAKLTALRDQWKQVKAQLAEAEKASEDKWDDTKRSFQKAADELRGAVNRARQDVSDAIEP